MDALLEDWKACRAAAPDSALEAFDLRLHRDWAIETGQIEGAYDIPPGVTEVLIDRGIDCAIEGHVSDPPSPDAIRLALSHQEVLEGLFAFVKGAGRLSTSFIKEMHAQLTQHQELARGRDTLGRIVEVPLLRGEYKRQANNPLMPDGSVHEYAPPLQVAGEMERLVDIHAAHVDERIDPVVQAAWLHHRFTQIHPFQDGNGRVARALATIVLIRAGMMPLYVDRLSRGTYLDSLGHADAGDDRAISTFVARRQSLVLVGALAHVADGRPADWSRVQPRATELAAAAQDRLRSAAPRGAVVAIGDPSTHAGFMPEVQALLHAKHFGYRVARSSAREWSELRLGGRVEGRLTIALTMPPTGDAPVLAAGATLTSWLPSGNGGHQRPPEALGRYPYFTTPHETAADALERFEAWLDEAVADGLARWRAMQA